MDIVKKKHFALSEIEPKFWIEILTFIQNNNGKMHLDNADN